MPPWVQKVTSRRVSTTRGEDDAIVIRRSFSRGGIHTGNTMSYVKYFDKEYPARVDVLWPDGSLYESFPQTEWGHGSEDLIKAAIYEMADALRGVDTRPKAVV